MYRFFNSTLRQLETSLAVPQSCQHRTQCDFHHNIMSTPSHLYLNFALSLASCSRPPIRSDHQLALLLLLSSYWSFPATDHNTLTPTPFEHILTEELRHQVDETVAELKAHDPTQHVLVSEHPSEEISRFLANSEHGFGLSNVKENEWQHCPWGILLGLYDSAHEVATSSMLIPRDDVEDLSLNSRLLAVRNMRRCSTKLCDIFQQFCHAVTKAKNAMYLVREAMNTTKAVQCGESNEKEWQTKRATFREMSVVRSREEGLKVCAASEWFVCISVTADESESVAENKQKQGVVYRVSELLSNTAERSTEKQGFQEQWRLPDNCTTAEETAGMDVNGKQEEEEEEEEEESFVVIENVRKAIRLANLEILEGSLPTKVSQVAIASMTLCTTKLSVLLHNLDYCCSQPSEVCQFSPSLYYFKKLGVLVIRGWAQVCEEVRSAWPSDASVYECLLPASGAWGKGGALVVIFRRHGVQSVVDYHHRFS